MDELNIENGLLKNLLLIARSNTVNSDKFNLKKINEIYGKSYWKQLTSEEHKLLKGFMESNFNMFDDYENYLKGKNKDGKTGI